jgi:predicted Zn-dependent peptidase
MSNRKYYYEPGDGVRPAIAYIQIKGMRSVHMGIAIKVGAYYENMPHLLGASHYTEHMCFNGTVTRSGDEVRNTLVRYGGNINAYTTTDHTTYHCTVPSEQFETAVDLLTDLTFFSVMDSKSMEKERNIIQSEIQRSLNNKWESLFTHLNSVVFEGTPMSHHTLGTKETVGNITRDELNDWYKQNYHLGNATYVVVGDIDYDFLVDTIYDYAFDVPFGKKNSDIILPEPKYLTDKIKRDDVYEDMVSICTFDNFDFLDEEALYRDQFNNWLGGSGFSSKLFNVVREKMSLCYSINSNYTNFIKGSSRLDICFSTLPGNHGKAVDAITEIIKQHKDGEGMTKDEFKIFLDYTKSNIAIEHDDPMKLFSRLLIITPSYDEDYILDVSYEERIKKLDNMKYDNYMDCTSNILDQSTMIVFEGNERAESSEDESN